MGGMDRNQVNYYPLQDREEYRTYQMHTRNSNLATPPQPDIHSEEQRITELTEQPEKITESMKESTQLDPSIEIPPSAILPKNS